MARVAREAAKDNAFMDFARRLGNIPGVEAFVREHYIYRDETEEIVRTPQFMLADMGRVEDGRVVGLEGDCDDVSTLFAAFTFALGYSTRFVAIRYHETNPNFEHVFTQAYDTGVWKVLDATIAPGTTMQWIEEMMEYV